MSALFLQSIERARRDLPGTFAVCAERLDRDAPDSREGARLAWDEDRVHPSASVIKIAVALEVFCAVEEGTLDLAAKVALREEDKVIGSGVLAGLGAGLPLSIEDLLYLSMAISDNTAANLLIDRVGAAAVNARLSMLGLVETRLLGKIMVPGGRDQERGELSPSTPSELVQLLRSIHHRSLLPARACDRLLLLLQRTQTASTIGRGLPDERFAVPSPLTLAYKTGSIEGVIAEAAIVCSPRTTYAIAVMSEGSRDLRPNHDNVGRVVLGEISRAIYSTFTSLGD